MRPPSAIPNIRPRALRTGLLLAVVALILPASASAAEQYELRPYGTKCVSGQFDERQYSYTICHDAIKENYLRVHDANGVQVSYTRMPGANDVAPAPDGSWVIVSGGSGNPLRKFTRQANGNYAQDYAWKPPTYVFDGVRVPANGRQIATDGYGNLYVASGMWTGDTPGNVNLTHSVAKFAPDGTVLDVFGGWSNTWKTGRVYAFYSLAGIAVSRDGRYIYTTEVHNGRVQRFDRDANGRYQLGTVWGNSQATDPYRLGLCTPTQLAAPYDIAVDAWGDVWTTSTSCTYVQKFSANGIWKFSSYVGNRGATAQGMLPNGEQERSHNLAVTARGDVIAGENSNVLVRGGVIPAWPAIDAAPQPDPNPVPNPNPVPDPVPNPQPNPNPVPVGDAADPVIATVTVPATTQSQVIDVTIAATDDVAVKQVRFANDYGVWEAWQAFTPAMRFSLRAGIGTRGVYTQVRDAANRESNVVYRTTIVTAQNPAPAPNPVPVPDPEPDPAPNPVPDPAPNPAPGPDVVAPTLRQVTVPATTATSAIDVVIDGIDDHAVTQMRLATDDGNWGAWQAFTPTVRFTLRAGIGFRGVYVQLRDAAGNESASLYRTTRVL
jgi:hypothetical protein